ncbi:hypothetical protein RF11_14258 [Thelohanellus kitauei]|uniref:Uncharacterized protein n=1 Tax=Thelohanellus kitauei TaxID=669202 RepID=A0A0C2MMR6_THEKT|nr:hypothetical protein RF11_14258 [Thelohanellus kitauei]
MICLDTPIGASSSVQEVSEVPDTTKIKRDVRIRIPRFVPIKGKTRYKIVEKPSGASSLINYEVLPLSSDISDESSDTHETVSWHQSEDDDGQEIKWTAPVAAGSTDANTDDDRSFGANVIDPETDIKSEASSIKQEASENSNLMQMNRELRVIIPTSDTSESATSYDLNEMEWRNIKTEPPAEPSNEFDTDSDILLASESDSTKVDMIPSVDQSKTGTGFDVNANQLRNIKLEPRAEPSYEFDTDILSTAQRILPADTDPINRQTDIDMGSQSTGSQGVEIPTERSAEQALRANTADSTTSIDQISLAQLVAVLNLLYTNYD